MLGVLINRFVDESENISDVKVRERYGRVAGVVGICVNVILFAAKLAIGIISGAISIVADALNNLSDAGTSIVTLWGFRIAAKPADDEHPFGHGRAEYLTGLLVAIVIMIVGFELFKDSVEKILHPEAVTFSSTTLIVLVLSILAKCFLAAFYRAIGTRIDSAAISAASLDSLTDCVATSAVIISLLVYNFAGINIAGYAGIVASLFILYSGWDAANATIQPLLGEAPDPRLMKEIRVMALDTRPIIGVHDLIVHNYGPGRTFCSLHAELPMDMGLAEAHAIIDDLERRIEEKLHIEVTVHLDPIDIETPETNKLRVIVGNIIQAIKPELSMHDFRLTPKSDGGDEHQNLIFDVIVPQKCSLSDDEIRETLQHHVKGIDERYNVVVHFDHQYC